MKTCISIAMQKNSIFVAGADPQSKIYNAIATVEVMEIKEAYGQKGMQFFFSYKFDTWWESRISPMIRERFILNCFTFLSSEKPQLTRSRYVLMSNNGL